MKRNMRFLLLFAILTSSILAAYFISGCGDDSTVIESEDVIKDTVIGVVHGTVRDAYTGSLLEGVAVVFSHAGQQYSVTTDADGYYTTDTILSSGQYQLTYTRTGHAGTQGVGTIQTVAGIRGNNPDVPAGEMLDEDVVNVTMWPMTGSLSGSVFTALPAGAPGKDGTTGLALDDPNLATAAPGVVVTLDYGQYNLILTGGDKYYDTTDANGVYSFSGVPVCQNDNVVGRYVQLATSSFTDNSTDYGPTSYGSAANPIILLPAAAGGGNVPNIYAPLDGDNPRNLDPSPVVINYSWDGTVVDVGDNLVVDFSQAMDPTTVQITLKLGATNIPFTFVWSNSDMTLTIDPANTLTTGSAYSVVISGESTNGLTLVDNNPITPNFTRTVNTQAGLDLVSTNLGTAGTFVTGSTYIDFALDADLVFTFNMDVDGSHAGTAITFMVAGTAVDFDTTFSGATVTINPDHALVQGQTYTLGFTFYSTIEGDSYLTPATYSVSTISTATLPATPDGFQWDTTMMAWPVDYNTTSLYVEWDIQADADSFMVYADADYTPLGRTVVKRVAAQQYGIKQGVTVDLSAFTAFDVYSDAQQTPFAGDERVSVWVRAWNAAGLSGYSDSLDFTDEQAPQDFLVNQWGDADNTGGTADDTVLIQVGTVGSPVEYLNEASAVFTFIEYGGDPAYTFAGTVTFDDDNTLTFGTGTFYVPGGSCAAGDLVEVAVTDNSGNTGKDTLRLLPYFEYVNPHPDSAAGQFENGDANGKFVAHMARALDGTALIDFNNVDMWLSLDGTALYDSLMTQGISDSGVVNTKSFDAMIDDTLMVNGVAKLAIAQAGGGCMYWSAPFTIAGLMMTGPDSASYYDVTDTIIDRGNSDSTYIPVSWTSMGIDSVVLWYSDDNGGTWAATDTLAATASPFNWYPPQAASYDARFRITDYDADDLPVNGTTWDFHVFHDSVTFTAPLAAGVFVGGSNTNIQWSNGVTGANDTLPSLFDVDYSTDATGADTTWTSLATAVPNSGIHMWSGVPNATPSTTCLVRFTDGGGNMFQSPLFVISGLVVTAPGGGEAWPEGVNQNITWNNVGGFTGNVDLHYKTTAATTWTAIATNQGNTGTYGWNPVDIDPGETYWVRVMENGGTIEDMSDSAWAVAGFAIDYPATNYVDTMVFGRSDSIGWTTFGAAGLTGNVTLKWLNGATLDTLFAGIADAGKQVFAVPDMGAGSYPDTVSIIIEDAGGTAADTVTQIIVYEPVIAVNTPTVDTTWQQNTSEGAITWDAIGLLGDSVVVSCYSSDDAGATFDVTLGTYAANDGQIASWSIPDLGIVGQTNAKIKVKDTGSALTGESAVFKMDP